MNAPPVGLAAGRRLSPAEVRSIVVGLMMAMLLAALDQTIVATAMPTIGRDLGDADNLPWIVTAYLLASTAVTPLYGKLSDIHGRRITLLFAIVAFVLGSVACALAPSMVMLALARGLQGVGGGGLISLAQTIIGDIMSPKERARYQVYIASVFVTSSLAGPLLGGVLAEHFHWSLIFWINLPIGIAAFIMTAGKLKLLPRYERPHRLDYPGAASLVVASTSLLLALSWGGQRYPWASVPVVSLLVGSALVWGLFVLRLLRAPEPLIPVSVLADRVIYSATLAACFAMGTFIGLTIYMPIFLEGVVGLTASQSGVALIPLMLGTVTGATISGRSMTYFKHYKVLPLIMMGVSVLACAALSLEGRHLPLWAMEALFLLISLGLGTILPLSTITIQNTVPMHQLGTATASMNFFRSLGGALIVAAFGTIVLSGMGGSTHDMEALIRGADATHLAHVFRWVFGAADLGLIVAWFFLAMLEQRPLVDRRGPEMSGEAAATIIMD
ncbi:MAG TPA: MDR family MFS transporter [Lichenihabitans sp.]|nr:MDR family MFS transporter [Lichenihabitans sp.]